MVDLYQETVERLELDVETSEDSTPFTVDFARTDNTTPTERPTSWRNATWKDVPKASGKGFLRVAVTPLFGDATWPIATDEDWRLWVRVTSGGGEVSVEPAGRVRIR